MANCTKKGVDVKNRVWMGAVALATQLALTAGVAHASDWWETIKVKGDLRYRHEMLDTDNQDARNRQRLRARFGIFAKASDYTEIGIQLASGSEDPVSTNQTLGDAFSTKRIGIDLAYFKATHSRLPGVTLEGGKFKNPFFKPGSSELIWDSDWNPEGGVLNFTRDFQDVTLTLIGSGLWIEERSTNKDSYLASAQGVFRYHLKPEKSSVAFGAGFFGYGNIQGFQPFFDPEDPFGNSTVMVEQGGDSVMVYAEKFQLLELFGEFTHKVNEVPLTLMVDYVNNTAADSLNSAWLIGMRLGKANKPGKWEFRYNYREVKKDAVVGLFNDSDFRGGGTDAKGHEFGGGVRLTHNTNFNVSYFMNEIGLQQPETSDFSRLQVDLQLKF
jgi:hypothetical protein